MNKIKENITICTVNCDDDILIQKNIDILSALEEDISINWIIAQNKNIDQINKKFIVKDNKITYVDGLPRDLIGAISLHHSIALNLTKKKINTRFVIFIDPDFFFIKKNSIREIIQDMKNNNIDMIGAPWHPKWYSKFKYFPCSHCLFVDTEKVSLDLLDFRPTKIVWDKKFNNFNVSHKKQFKNNKIISVFYEKIYKKYFFKFYQFINFMFFFRTKIGFDGDTSSRIYLNLYKSDVNFKIFNPYFNISHDWLVPIPWSINRFIEYFLPERFCYFPKKKDFVKFNEKFGDF